METINNISRAEMPSIIAKFIKEEYSRMGDKTNITLDVEHCTWVSGIGRDKKFSRSEICLGYTKYIFTDKEVTEEEFIRTLNKGLELSKVNGKVFTEEYGYGYSRQTMFKRIELFGIPCKEFNQLNKTLVKYGAKPINELDVYSVNICGKRSSYGDTGKYFYLCYNARKCSHIIDYIKCNRGRNGIVSTSVKEYLDNGNEYEYEIAQYRESEWYGSRGNYLILSIKQGKGKKDYEKKFLI